MKKFWSKLRGRSTESSTSRGDKSRDSSEERRSTSPRDFLRAQAEETDRSSDSSDAKENDSLSEYKSEFNIQIKKKPGKKGVFAVESNSNNKGLYTNIIDVRKGRIEGLSNYKRSDGGKWHLSEVIYHQILLAVEEYGKDISDFNLTRWDGKNILDKSTVRVAKRVLEGENERTFGAGTEEFNDLARTETAKAKFHLLRDHFPNKEVTSIKVIRNNQGAFDITYEIR